MRDKYLAQLNILASLIEEKHSNKIEAFFVHGSFASNMASPNSYQEQMFLHKNVLWFSIFQFKEISPDVDCIIIAHNPKDVLDSIEMIVPKIMSKDYHLTLNVITPDVYEKLVQSDVPTAPKRLLVARQIIPLIGNDYVAHLKEIATEHYHDVDDAVQREFDSKKLMLKNLCENKVMNHILFRNEYKTKYPSLLNEIEGVTIGGFNIERIKYVYPDPMNLKCRTDIMAFTTIYPE